MASFAYNCGENGRRRMERKARYLEAHDIELRSTCFACPEQYDAIDKATGETVGYLRLRHGHFTVEVPDAWGELVYESWPQGDGRFEDGERETELSAALDAIAAWHS